MAVYASTVVIACRIQSRPELWTRGPFQCLVMLANNIQRTPSEVVFSLFFLVYFINNGDVYLVVEVDSYMQRTKVSPTLRISFGKPSHPLSPIPSLASWLL